MASEKTRPDAMEPIIAGYITKLGQVVKNWKLRWMVLTKKGELYYYKKQCKIGEQEPQGVVNVTADCLELMTMEEVTLLGLAKFPANAPPGSGFAMCTRKGRVFIMHSESPERGQEWIKAIRSVGANIRASSDTTLELKKKASSASVEGEQHKEKLDQIRSSLAGEDDGAAAAPASASSSAPASPPKQPTSPPPPPPTQEMANLSTEGEQAPTSGDESGEELKYVHKLVGGVIIKTVKK